MAEVTHTGEHHGHIVFVGRGDDLLVAHGSAGLDHRAHAGCGGCRYRRGTGKRRPMPLPIPALEPGLLGLDGRDARELTRLICPAPTPMVMPSLAVHDGVGLDELGHRPGEQQVRIFAVSGLPLADTSSVIGQKPGRHPAQQAAVDPLEVEPAPALSHSPHASTRTFFLPR